MSEERLICKPQNIYDPKRGGRWQHPDAKDDDECSDGCCDFNKCPWCGLRFRVDVAQ